MKPFITKIIFLLLCGSCILNAQPEAEEKKVIITNEATINTPHLDYSPAFFEDGIVFISSKVSSNRYKVTDKRINENIMSIYRSRRSESGALMTPTPFANELLSTVHEGPMTFDRTAENIFFTRNNVVDGRKIKAKDGIVKLKIYTAYKIKDQWSNIEELSFNDNESNTAHPSISVDGKLLYFASDRPGGMGGMDIWVAPRKGNGWGTPTNMGPMVNTDGDEIFPFIHADGTLYFASTGHSGLGGLDLFYTSPNTEGIWKKPTNMGKPFNTESDDFGFIVDRDKRNGYFSSNRTGGLGEDDIYSFYSLDNLDALAGNVRRDPNETRQIELAVINEETGDLIEGAAINYILIDELTLAKALVNDPNGNLSNDEVLLRLPFEDGNLQGVTDSNGIFPVEVKYANYIFNIAKPGFQNRQVVLTANSDVKQFLVTMAMGSGTASTLTDISTDPGSSGQNPGTNPGGITTIGDLNDLNVPTIQTGTIIELPNIYYNFNDASIRPDARIDLDVVAGLLKKFPEMEIELASHTDSRGDERYNKRLSQKRAESAVAYLVRQGIDKNRLLAVGYGESEVRNRCVDGVDCQENEHQYNRRSEVRITKMAAVDNTRFVNDTSAPGNNDYTANSSSGTDGTTTSSSDNFGEVQVITGIFNNLPNAERRLSQVMNLGFTSAQIVASPGNRHMVVAGRYYSRGEAETAAGALNDGGIKTYIKEN